MAFIIPKLPLLYILCRVKFIRHGVFCSVLTSFHCWKDKNEKQFRVKVLVKSYTDLLIFFYAQCMELPAVSGIVPLIYASTMRDFVLICSVFIYVKHNSEPI